MLITHNKTTAWLIGDPHMGRRFERGVPLHRRGEREASQLAQLKDELATPDVKYNINVGDVFDHPHVSFKVILDVARTYVEAANISLTHYVILAGNHDLPRNTEVVGAFDMLEELLEGYTRITVVRKPTIIDGIALFPWEWTRSAEDQVADLAGQSYDFAVGHWDLQSFGGDDSHMAPTAVIPEGIDLYSGHYHLAGDYEVYGRTVHCTGSMLPYTHAEDPDGEIYVTYTLEEFNDVDPATLINKCVRILLKPGEELPADLDCLALTAKRVLEEDTETEITQLDDFNWSKILASKMESLEPYVVDFINQKTGEYNVETSD